MGYREEAEGFLDYRFAGTPFGFHVRGPVSFEDSFVENSVSFLGAAQTVGVWCKYPFPTLVSNALSCNALNLGYGGAGPALYAFNSSLIDTVNRSKLCVVQVMSGRSVHNSLMEQVDGGATVILRMPGEEPEKMLAHNAYHRLLATFSRDAIQRIVDESLSNYVEQYEKLASLISVPKILLWVSSREPHYERSFESYSRLLSTFPHLIDSQTFSAISPFFDAVVEATSDRFLGMPLWSEDKKTTFEVARSWGTLTTYGHDYSQPYLHIHAAHKLLDKILELDIFG